MGQLVNSSLKQIPEMISFCMTCMGRAEQVRQTLPLTLLHNAALNIEVVLVDYNSADHLQEWVLQTLPKEIAEARLKYVRLDWPRRFHRSHAKNVAHRAATGEILINLDADNIATAPYTTSVRCKFGQGFDVVSVDRTDPRVMGGGGGRVAISRELFYRIGGYDETMSGWGYEDVDFTLRASLAGGKMALVDAETLRFIKHEDRLRVASGDASRQQTDARNRLISQENLSRGIYRANADKEWGRK